ncbi:MAG: hypothetical protein CL933_07275 [Deltaproteobacteria bacterium]|nr:hypothetical protein [Deltaproteobacteria bacterium]
MRCGLCGTVCESSCIQHFGLDEPEHGAFTPYLDVRDRSCVLCIRCTKVCPTGALSEVEDELEVIAKRVDMGKAWSIPTAACLVRAGSAASVMTPALSRAKRFGWFPEPSPW